MERVTSSLYLLLFAHLATVFHLAEVLQGDHIIILYFIHRSEDILEILVVPSARTDILSIVSCKPEEVEIPFTLLCARACSRSWLFRLFLSRGRVVG